MIVRALKLTKNQIFAILKYRTLKFINIENMKHFIICLLVCLSALFGFGYFNYSYICSTENNNREIAIDSINKEELLKKNLKNDLINEVRTYISNNSKHQDTLLVIEISEHIVNRALDNHIDICFILAQGHLETSFGSYGIGKSKKSIFGVYKNYDSYTECIDYYIHLLRRSYLVNKTEKQLMNNYVNHSGYRYAEDENYEHKLKNYYSKINKSTSILELQYKYINENIQTENG